MPADPVPLVYQLRIALRAIEPPIWRRIQVPGAMTLPRLHRGGFGGSLDPEAFDLDAVNRALRRIR